MIPLQALEGFYWVVRAGGYASAARSFAYPITHAGVHQQVRRLENALEVRLFRRVAKDRVTLTAAGKYLHAFVAPLIEQAPLVERALKGGDFGGTLKIHAAGQILKHLLPGWLRRLRRRRPDIDVVLEEVGSADPELLRRGETDLLVDYLPAVPPGIAVACVGRVSPFLVLPARHRLASRSRVALSAFQGEPFIAYTLDRKHRLLQTQALSQAGVTPGRTLSASSSETILAFVAAGLGFSLVPWLQPGRPRLEGVVAHPLGGRAAQFPIFAAWLEAPANPLVQAALAEAPRPIP
ncbi:MAG TPA: LysR family transcriptional regulator [Myxococcaceae bacterium]|nr:LysR family transcriptional regulator [Myxococcaceae bacterium]